MKITNTLLLQIQSQNNSNIRDGLGFWFENPEKKNYWEQHSHTDSLKVNSTMEILTGNVLYSKTEFEQCGTPHIVVGIWIVYAMKTSFTVKRKQSKPAPIFVGLDWKKKHLKFYSVSKVEEKKKENRKKMIEKTSNCFSSRAVRINWKLLFPTLVSIVICCWWYLYSSLWRPMLWNFVAEVKCTTQTSQKRHPQQLLLRVHASQLITAHWNENYMWNE